jgi:hypothetical protein
VEFRYFELDLFLMEIKRVRNDASGERVGDSTSIVVRFGVQDKGWVVPLKISVRDLQGLV